jgi:hypothetical protein
MPKILRSDIINVVHKKIIPLDNFQCRHILLWPLSFIITRDTRGELSSGCFVFWLPYFKYLGQLTYIL